jgi:FkbM family methyltransferase
MLPLYQPRHPRYDRFLPLLALHLSPDETVVDVGANVGDTLAAMADRNARLRYVCIEADEVFFGWLRRNIARVQAARPELRADAIQALVGRSVAGAALEGHGGTKHAVPGAAGGVESRPLDHVLAERDCGPVRLLKSDVDGFDYDAIDSSLRVVDADGPLLFFECQCDTAAQKAGYERTLAALAERGYVD